MRPATHAAARLLEYATLDEPLEPQPDDLLDFLGREQVAFEPRQLPGARKILA